MVSRLLWHKTIPEHTGLAHFRQDLIAQRLDWLLFERGRRSDQAINGWRDILPQKWLEPRQDHLSPL